ncbi:MAG TPA: RNA polymerase sigma factor [Pyrinomonadaceae bacterium]|nr:RNA polymerase sigma factor [Pyrinomonadaceae bacterium]
MPERITDERALDRAVGGDETAFILLYERHRDAVFRFAYRLLGSAELAEDVTHDCFLSLMRRPRSFDPTRSQLRTYLFAAARNLAFKRLQARGQDVTVEDLAAEPRLPEREEPLQKLLREELEREVSRAVAGLPPLQREALILFEYEELSLAEVAMIVGKDVGTVKARLHRARQRLRKVLAPYFNSSRETVAAE